MPQATQHGRKEILEEIQTVVSALDFEIYHSFSFTWKHWIYFLAHEKYIGVAYHHTDRSGHSLKPRFIKLDVGFTLAGCTKSSAVHACLVQAAFQSGRFL